MDVISRQDAIKAIESLPNCYNGYSDTYDKAYIIGTLEEVPSAEPTLYGYNIEHLVMIAKVMEKDNISPQKVAEILSDVGRVAKMIYDEQSELVRKEVERWI